MSIHSRVVTAIAVLIIVVPTVAWANEADADAKEPQLVAIKLHADWCGSCRRMGPVFEDLGTVMEEAPVLFVHLDLTDRASRKQAAYLMEMMGLSEVWHQYDSGKKTGLIVVVDADTKKPVTHLTADQTLKQMKAALEESLQQSQD